MSMFAGTSVCKQLFTKSLFRSQLTDAHPNQRISCHCTIFGTRYQRACKCQKWQVSSSRSAM